jgi:hypothetical protein
MALTKFDHKCVLTCSRVSLGFVGEVFEVMNKVDHDLTPANRFDRPLGLIKNLGCHIHRQQNPSAVAHGASRPAATVAHGART